MKTSASSIFVTGATGFIGSHLAKSLIRDGHQVHTFVRSQSPRSVPDGVTAHPYHNNDLGKSVAKAIQASRPKLIFHLASLFIAEHTYQDIEPLVASNITLSTQLVDQAVTQGCPPIVTAGTAWQNFKGQKGVASCLYAATKEAFETIVRYYIDAFPLQVISLKIYDSYGPEDPRGKLVSALFKAAHHQTPLTFSPGDQKIDLLHVDDLVRAFHIAGERALGKASSDKGHMEEFYLTSGSPRTLKDVVKTFEQATGKSLKVDFGGRPYRAREVMEPWASGPILPNWVPEVSLEQGFRQISSERLLL